MVSAFATLMFACTSEDTEFALDTTIGTVQQSPNKYHITQDQAVSTLMKILACEGSTRASFDHIENVKPIVSLGLTRTDAGKVDTTLYVVNFKESKGFAIMSADTRTEPVFAILDNGNYDGGEEYESLIKASEAYANSVATTRANRVGGEDSIGQYDYTGTYRLSANGRNHLKGYNWHNESPFCDYTIAITGLSNARPGCSAVAIGLALTYFGIDPQIDGLSVDYSLMPKDEDEANENSAKKAEVGKLLYYIAKRLNTNFIGGKANRSTVEAYVQTLPTKYKTAFRDFDDENAAANFYSALRTEKKSVIVMEGTYKDSISSGHTWLVDGIKLYDVMKGSEKGYTMVLYHSVFGNGGGADGYYLQHIMFLYNSFELSSWHVYHDIPKADNYESLDYLYNIRYCALSQRSIMDHE